MNKGEVVVGEAGDVACNTSVNVLWVTVVFKVFVVSIHSDGSLGSHEEMSPVGETLYDSQEFTVVDIIVLFCFGESL